MINRGILSYIAIFLTAIFVLLAAVFKDRVYKLSSYVNLTVHACLLRVVVRLS